MISHDVSEAVETDKENGLTKHFLFIAKFWGALYTTPYDREIGS